MPLSINIELNNVLSLPNGLFRFVKEKPGNVLLMENTKTGLEIRLREHKLVDMLGRGTAKPTLTFNMDVATRCVLGYLVSFEPASL